MSTKNVAISPATKSAAVLPINKCCDLQRLFAARPSGTENIFYKIYAESFKDQSHLNTIVNEAQKIVNNVLL